MLHVLGRARQLAKLKEVAFRVSQGTWSWERVPFAAGLDSLWLSEQLLVPEFQGLQKLLLKCSGGVYATESAPGVTTVRTQ